MNRCTCRHGVRPLGRLHGFDMGVCLQRLSTTPKCPVHDSCRGYTKAYRESLLPDRLGPCCPIHPKAACPEPVGSSAGRSGAQNRAHQ
jgi:hypothetical protein